MRRRALRGVALAVLIGAQLLADRALFWPIPDYPTDAPHTWPIFTPICMIIATAATLHATGHFQVDTAADAARALEPVVGTSAKTLFGVGLLGASLLAGAVLPLATAYAVSEAFGTSKGVHLDFRRARLFYGLFSTLILLGAGLALVPGLPVISLLVVMQVLNGALLPIVLVFILLLVNDPRVAGELRNSRRCNVVAWATFALVTGSVVVMLLDQALGLFGRHLF